METKIFENLKLCGKDKAPGPNGFTTEFFVPNWDCVKSKVLRAVKDYFKKGKLLGEANRTHICLIPKGPNYERVEYFRPISLCNIIYKITDTCIAERLKTYLNELISLNQSTFIAGIKISENILLTRAYERLQLETIDNKVLHPGRHIQGF